MFGDQDRIAGHADDAALSGFTQPGEGSLPRLIGFEAARDRQFFELFTTVKGIGNRKALKAMAIEPAAIAALIVAKDAKARPNYPRSASGWRRR